MKSLILAFVFLLSLPWARAPERLRQYPAQTRALTQFQTNSAIFSGTGGSSTSNTSNPWAGAQSNQLTVGPSSTVLFTQTISPAVNVCNDSGFRVTFRITNKNNVMNHNRLDFYVLNDLTNFILYEFGSFGIRDSNLTYWGDWSQYHVSRKLMAQTGTFNCASVNTIAFGLRAETGTQDTITFGEVAAFPRRSPKATLIINEDDQWLSWFTNGAPKLDSMGVRHTIFLNSSRVGLTNYATEAIIDDLCRVRKRCDVGNHLLTHDSATDLSTDSLLASIRRNRDYIRSRGWKGYSMLAYPFGKKSRVVDSVIRKSGLVDFARLTKGNSYGEAQQFNDNYNIRVLSSLGVSTSAATLKAVIDTVINHRSVGIFLLHEVGAVGCTEDGNTICKDKWLDVMNHAQTKIDAGTLQMMSLGDYLERYGGGAGPSRRLGVGR